MFAQTDFVKKILTSTLLSIFKIFSKISKVADFFVDGHFDFHDKLWKSSSGIINESRWHVSSDFDWRTYPVLLDRVAYTKNWFPKFRRKYMVQLMLRDTFNIERRWLILILIVL